MAETRRFDCDAVVSVPGPPGEAVVVGDGYQWSDDSDDTYAISTTPDFATYSVAGAKIRLRETILTVDNVEFHIRAKANRSERIGIGLGTGLGDDDNNQGFAGPILTTAADHHVVTAILPGDFKFWVQTHDPYAYVTAPTLGLTVTTYELWFIVTGTFADPEPAYVPLPCRRYPRADRGPGVTRSYPRPSRRSYPRAP